MADPTPEPPGERESRLSLPERETAILPEGQRPGASPARAPRGEVRFTPGTMLSGRYRIVALLGKGGMGEVYRAEDTRLGQTVALKFLPEALGADPVRLERFYAEVRIGRQVSHPNVCRVYDLVEAEGHRFLSMEYVDGEDLASLLRRIGRLPPGKALDIGRDLCAGLAAAHDAGVLHRDLKPANVMLDGRGRARITDFGLAALAHEAGGEALAGTPAYMAPEQLLRKEASLRSDLYALGLVLYEVFTGRPAFEPASAAQRIARADKRPPIPSSLVPDIDPTVERLILRCLADDPDARPASAREMMAALPGGDPLQAALAAGETPSPEMVAAAGRVGDLRPAAAWAYLLILLAGLILVALLPRQTAFQRLIEKPPEVMAERAREILRKAGHGERPLDSAYGFLRNEAYLRYAASDDPSRVLDRPAADRGAAIFFWYRESPDHLVSLGGDGVVSPTDPPGTLPGMANVELDVQGRLMSLRVVPPQFEESPGPRRDPEWPTLFGEAGLEMDRFRLTDPRWTPPVASDSHSAWEGSFPESPEIPVRIEAAAYHGKPVWFAVLGPWVKPLRPEPSRITLEKVVWSSFDLSILVGVVGAVILARRNLRLGKGDRKGAFKLAASFFVLQMVVWGLGADHVPRVFGEGRLLYRASSQGLFWAAVIWLVYVALEPYLRRSWPNVLISWARLLAGRFRDPLVGRDVLLGALFGTAGILLEGLESLAVSHVELPPMLKNVEALSSPHLFPSLFLSHVYLAMFFGLGLLFLLFLLRLALRKQWLAVLVWAALVTSWAGHTSEGLTGHLLFAAVRAGLMALALTRVGLLSFSVTVFVWLYFGSSYPPDFESWYAGRSVLDMVALLALVAYGFYVSLGGKPMLGRPLLEG